MPLASEIPPPSVSLWAPVASHGCLGDDIMVLFEEAQCPMLSPLSEISEECVILEDSEGLYGDNNDDDADAKDQVDNGEAGDGELVGNGPSNEEDDED
ncbi:hypothetical protein ABZP36_028424 [Zizania latifolia]